MPRILVLQHVAHKILGGLDPILRGERLRIRYVNFDRDPAARPCIESYDGLVVLGGPMSAFDEDNYPHLETEVALIRAALERDLPVLGICLGAQLLARALGARVERAPCKEIGWTEVHLTAAGRADPMLGHFAEREHLFQWHSDTFELPRGATHLASSPACAHQAFRFGDHAWGLQFHLEADEAMILRWVGDASHRAELEALLGPIDIGALRAESVRHLERSRELGSQVFGAFASRCNDAPRGRVLATS